MYRVIAQGVDERTINVHYYYFADVTVVVMSACSFCGHYGRCGVGLVILQTLLSL